MSVTSSSGPQTLRCKVVFAQCHHHHWSCVVHGCRLSATKLSLLASGTNYHTASCLHSPYKLSAIVWIIFSVVLFPTFCSACEVTCVIIGHLDRFCYLFTLKFVHVVTAQCIRCYVALFYYWFCDSSVVSQSCIMFYFSAEVVKKYEFRRLFQSLHWN